MSLNQHICLVFSRLIFTFLLTFIDFFETFTISRKKILNKLIFCSFLFTNFKCYSQLSSFRSNSSRKTEVFLRQSKIFAQIHKLCIFYGRVIIFVFLSNLFLIQDCVIFYEWNEGFSKLFHSI
jgi:hypothetical protein